MNDLASIRRANLEKLVSAHKTQRNVSEVTGLAAAYINQLLTRHRNIGEKTARKIEEAAGLASGWMDKPHDDYTPPGDAVDFSATSEPQTNRAAAEAAMLLPDATPRSSAALGRIIEAANEGRLTDADLELLNQIAEHIAARKE